MMKRTDWLVTFLLTAVVGLLIVLWMFVSAPPKIERVFVPIHVYHPTPAPVGRWHEAGVNFENSLFHVRQSEHYFIEYETGVYCGVGKDEWELAPKRNPHYE